MFYSFIYIFVHIYIAGFWLRTRRKAVEHELDRSNNHSRDTWNDPKEARKETGRAGDLWKD